MKRIQRIKCNIEPLSEKCLNFHLPNITIENMFTVGRFGKLMVHCIAWAVFILSEVANALSFGMKIGIIDFVFYYIANIGFFYATAHVLIEYTIKRKESAIFILIIILLQFAAYFLIVFSIDNFLTKAHTGHFIKHFQLAQYIRTFHRGFLFFLIAAGYWLSARAVYQTTQNNRLLIEKLRTEAELLKMENTFLHGQINKHLLFNGLAAIHSRVEQILPKVAESIVLLSDTIRFSLQKLDQEDKIALENELMQIERYITLNQLLYDDGLCVNLDLTSLGTISHLRILPAILLTLVENVFTHGRLDDTANPALIRISYDGKALHFHSQNVVAENSITDTHGIGILNLRARLDRYYHNDAYNLQVLTTNGLFITDLTLKL